MNPVPSAVALVDNGTNPLPRMITPRDLDSVWPPAALVLILALLFGADGGLSRCHRAELRRSAEQELQTMAEFKADQIAVWRAAQLAEAALLMDTPPLQTALARWIVSPQARLAEEVQAGFRALQRYREYRDVMAVGADGRVLFSLAGDRGIIQEEAAVALNMALRERRAVLTDLYTGPRGLPPHVDTLVPIVSPSRPLTPTCGPLLLQSDAWRPPSRSSKRRCVIRPKIARGWRNGQNRFRGPGSRCC